MGKSKLWSRLVGDFEAAGDLYLREGHMVRAAEMYARAGKISEAARLYFRAGLPEEGVAFLEQADSPLEAANLLVAEGFHREAVRYFERAGALIRAAEAALKSNQLLRAAGLYERAEAFDHAARCYEKGEALDQAAKCWALESERLAGDVEERSKVDRHRALVLGKLRRYEEAAAILADLGVHDRAAEMWNKARRPTQAVRSLLAAGRGSEAAVLCEQMTSGELDPALHAEVLSAAGRHREAAELYLSAGDRAAAARSLESAGDWARAAEVAEQHGDLERAGELYSLNERWGDAARCYRELGQPRSAAEAWRAAGEHQLAAGAYLEADLPMEAARSFLDAADDDSAIRALLAVAADDESYSEATLMLAPLLISRGDARNALGRLEGLPSGVGEDPLMLEREYWRGRAQHQLGLDRDAERSYARVVRLDRNHRDVAMRLLELRGKTAEQQQRTVAATQAIESMHMPQLLADRYEVGEELGRGGMSRVFRAFDRERNERVALKILLSGPVGAADAEMRLLNEFHICQRIRHPNVVRLYDYGRWHGTLYVTMELLEGVTLATLLDQGERLSVDRVHHLLCEVLSGLEAAHAEHVVHRDLKPANIAVTPSLVKIMDFGIAWARDSDVNVTRTGQVVGSPLYMSPEQIQGLDLDGRSDLYSMGVLAFTLLTGGEPFRGPTPMAVSLKHLQEAAPDLGDLRPDLPTSWHRFVARLLEKDPDRRYETALEARQALELLPVAV